MRRINHWEISWTKQALTPNLEQIKKKFAHRNYKIHWFLDALGNYLLVSKLLGETYIHLILQLKYVANSQIVLRDLLIVLQILDYCQLSVFLFPILLMGSVVENNCSEKHINVFFGRVILHNTVLFQKNLIQKHGMVPCLLRSFSII